MKPLHIRLSIEDTQKVEDYRQRVKRERFIDLSANQAANQLIHLGLLTMVEGNRQVIGK